MADNDVSAQSQDNDIGPDKVGRFRAFLADVLEGSAGRTTHSSARALGMPRAEGLTPEETKLLASLGVAKKKLTAQEQGLNLKALLSEHSEKGRSKDRDIKIFGELNKALSLQSQVGGQMAEGGNDNAMLMIKYMRDVLGEHLGKSVGADAAKAGKTKYKTKEDVIKAFKNKQITEQEAKSVLSSQFGIK